MEQVSDWNRRGVQLKQQGKFVEAVACYEEAIRLDPACAEAHFNLGLLWRDLGSVDRSIGCVETTARLRPDLFAVQFELGRLYFAQRRWEAAERVFDRLVRTAPGEIEAYLLLAVARQEQGRFAEAAAAYRRVLELQPQHAVALTNLGQLLKNQGQLAEAIASYERAIEADPRLVEAHTNLGNSWLESGRFDAAHSEYLVAASLRPDDPRSHIDLGNSLQRLDKTAEAIAAYRRALELDSSCTDAWINCSHLLKEVGDFQQARTVCEALARRHPADPWHALRAAATCPLVFRSHDELREYRELLETMANAVALAERQLEFARWTVYAPECPYNLQFLDGNLLPLKMAFAKIYTPYFSQFRAATRPPLRARPRLGFVVTARHENAFLKLLGGVVDRLDGARWELVVLCSQLGAERIRAGLRRDDLTVVAFPERFDHIVASVRDTACDLLYYWEVGNDPTNYFLPFLRLAPVQVTSWGIQVTTGIPTVDAYLSSDLVETYDAQQHYSERLIRASTLLTYQTPVVPPGSPRSRSDFGFSTQQHLYGCLQNLGKFHPDFDAVLADILRRDPLGQLVVVRDQNGFAAQILQDRWGTTMPDVAPRIRLVDPLDQPGYLSLLAACDVLLDPIHFGGVTTTYDALALQQPVVTLPTDYHRGRYTAACLTRIGITDTIARSCDDYARIAVELATERDRRHALRLRLREAGRGVFEDHVAVREHERIFEELLGSGR